MNVIAHEAGQCAHGDIKLEGTLVVGPRTCVESVKRHMTGNSLLRMREKRGMLNNTMGEVP